MCDISAPIYPGLTVAFSVDVFSVTGVSFQWRHDGVLLAGATNRVLSLAGVKIPGYFQGRAFAGAARTPAPEFTYNFRDRMDERIDLCRAVTDGRYRYIRNYRPELPTMQYVTYLWQQATMKDWDRLHKEGKLNAVQESFFQPHPAEQLFDLTKDYDNVNNLAGDPAHRATLERLRAANRAHLLRIRDTGLMPEAILRELSGEKSPTEFSRDDAARFIGESSPVSSSAKPFFASAFQHPMIFAASSTRSSLFSSLSRFWMRRLTCFSSTASTMTL